MPSKNHTLGFSTFLKLLELPKDKKKIMLKGFTRDGGYNYWHPLQYLADEVARQKLTGGEIADRVSLMCKGHQQKYNYQALTKISHWFERRKIKFVDKPKRRIKKFTNSGLKIRLEPEVAFVMGGVKYMMHVWATNTPSLSEKTLSAGLFFFQHHLRNEGYDDFQYMIYDTTKEKVLSEFDILHNADQVLSNERMVIQDLWDEVWNEKGKPKGDEAWLPGDHPGLN